jgi:acyl-CoA synthetase (AMP-forming)/AMP-acid ligase II
LAARQERGCTGQEIDHQVKIRGYRIELEEIEAVLNGHRGVKQCVVVAEEDERGDKRLIAYVVSEAGTTSPELKAYLRERLPGYMVPEAILALESMPVTANGKIDRKRLQRKMQADSYGMNILARETLLRRFSWGSSRRC